LYTGCNGGSGSLSMDFELTDEQRSLRASIVDFARRELNDDLVERDKEAAFSRDAWRKCAELGILGLPVPEAYGGTGTDATTTMVALEALGYACADNGLLFSLNAQLWAIETPIIRFGSEEQKQRYLPGLADGSIVGAHGMSEPASGSDAFSLSTTARKDGDEYVLDGSKTFVTNAPESDLFVVFATIDKELGFAGVTAFLLDKGTPGLTVGKPLSKMGLRTSPMSELFFDGCRVPAANVLGKPGGGMRVFDVSMTWERGCILASTVGTMERQLERSLAYAQERKQFGAPIGSFQAVSHKLVDMKLRLETSRLLLYHLASLIDAGKPTGLESALVKLHLSDSFVRSSMDALQVHGGYGYMTEYELERDVRDAIGSKLYSGTSELQYAIVAKNLGL
jgi:alkylation response protein AidB-like acyl-CoA dehydrogenase